MVKKISAVSFALIIGIIFLFSAHLQQIHSNTSFCNGAYLDKSTASDQDSAFNVTFHVNTSNSSCLQDPQIYYALIATPPNVSITYPNGANHVLAYFITKISKTGQISGTWNIQQTVKSYLIANPNGNYQKVPWQVTLCQVGHNNVQNLGACDVNGPGFLDNTTSITVTGIPPTSATLPIVTPLDATQRCALRINTSDAITVHNTQKGTAYHTWYTNNGNNSPDDQSKFMATGTTSSINILNLPPMGFINTGQHYQPDQTWCVDVVGQQNVTKSNCLFLYEFNNLTPSGDTSCASKSWPQNNIPKISGPNVPGRGTSPTSVVCQVHQGTPVNFTATNILPNFFYRWWWQGDTFDSSNMTANDSQILQADGSGSDIPWQGETKSRTAGQRYKMCFDIAYGFDTFNLQFNKSAVSFYQLHNFWDHNVTREINNVNCLDIDIVQGDPIQNLDCNKWGAPTPPPPPPVLCDLENGTCTQTTDCTNPLLPVLDAKAGCDKKNGPGFVCCKPQCNQLNGTCDTGVGQPYCCGEYDKTSKLQCIFSQPDRPGACQTCTTDKSPQPQCGPNPITGDSTCCSGLSCNFKTSTCHACVQLGTACDDGDHQCCTGGTCSGGTCKVCDVGATCQTDANCCQDQGYTCGQNHQCFFSPPTPTPFDAPFPTFAVYNTCPNGICNTAIGLIHADPQTFITDLFRIALSVGGSIALIIILYAGYELVMSQGDPQKIQGAKETLTSAIVGLLFIVFSIVILETIGVDILHIPGLGH